MTRKSVEDSSHNGAARSYRKRARSQNLDVLDDTESVARSSPRRKRNGRLDENSEEELQLNLPEGEVEEVHTELGIDGESPFKWTRRRRNDTLDQPAAEESTTTPKRARKGKTPLLTPKSNGVANGNETLPKFPDPDRSARRKSARTIIERSIADNDSENEVDEDLARQIYESDAEDDVEEDNPEEDDEVQEPDNAPVTPSKRGRGRPKGSGKQQSSRARQRSPTSPQDLPPHELYFAQNRAAGSKTSHNNFSSVALLDHDEFYSLMREYRDPHSEDMDFLHELHSRSFNQWQFEASQDFNICIYGWGSKRKLLTSFAEHVYKFHADHENNKIVVVNGYVHNTTIRDILNTLAGAISSSAPKLGSQVAEALETVCALLEKDKTKHITLIIHSIDASPLRRSSTQRVLARLASHPQIDLIGSADHPSFPLLWDSSLRSTYNFIFHDCTTFQPYTTEVDVVNEVHELLGRSGRRVGGKEGISFVLKSLNQNSRKLFQLLVAEQLAAIDEGVSGGYENDENLNDYDLDELNSYEKRGGGNENRRNDQGVEYRMLYQKAVEDFICGDEVSFRTLLKEFHDHQMIISRKDAMGTEILSVPFRKEELETILEDLMG